MVSREKWEESVEAWAWVFRLLQVLEGTTTKTKATSLTTTTTSKENRASCTGASRGRKCSTSTRSRDGHSGATKLAAQCP